MTHRQARRKLGSRAVRRRNTNGKNIRFFPSVDGEPKRPAPLGNSGRIIYKYLHPHPCSRKVAVAVKRLIAGGAR